MEKISLILGTILSILPVALVVILVFELGGSFISLQGYFYWWVLAIWLYLTFTHKASIKLTFKVAFGLFTIAATLVLFDQLVLAEVIMRISILFWGIAIGWSFVKAIKNKI